MSGMDNESNAAMSDPVKVTLVVVGRNGHTVELAHPVLEDEEAEVTYEQDYERPDVFDPMSPFVTKAERPSRRTFTFRVQMQRRAARRSL